MLTVLTPRLTSRIRCPLVTSSVSAGFPSPAEDSVTAVLDLNEHLIHNPMFTFYVRVSGHSMERVGINDGDLLVVDRSVEPLDGHVVVALVDGEFTVKRLKVGEGHARLEPENPEFPPYVLQGHQDFQVWGVVTHVIHTL